MSDSLKKPKKAVFCFPFSVKIKSKFKGPLARTENRKQIGRPVAATHGVTVAQASSL
jgi:hypothetical protein